MVYDSGAHTKCYHQNLLEAHEIPDYKALLPISNSVGPGMTQEFVFLMSSQVILMVLEPCNGYQWSML